MHGLNWLFLRSYRVKNDLIVYLINKIILFITYFDLPTAESPINIIFKSDFCLKNSSSFNSVEDIFLPRFASDCFSDILFLILIFLNN